MIPDKPGYWWMEAKASGKTRKFIADVVFFDGKPVHFNHDCEGGLPCDIPEVKWLGPVVDPFADVVEFHEAMFPHLIAKHGPEIPHDPSTKELHLNLIQEEYREMVMGIHADNMIEIVDGALDLIYVVLGMLVTYGVIPWPIWQAIHASNMAKKDGPKRADGKQQKPPGWQPPDVAGCLKAQGWEGGHDA